MPRLPTLKPVPVLQAHTLLFPGDHRVATRRNKDSTISTRSPADPLEARSSILSGGVKASETVKSGRPFPTAGPAEAG